MDIKEMVENVLVDDPVKTVTKNENRLEVISNDDDIKTDYNYARENYYNLMEKGYDALDELLEIAKSSENRSCSISCKRRQSARSRANKPVGSNVCSLSRTASASSSLLPLNAAISATLMPIHPVGSSALTK